MENKYLKYKLKYLKLKNKYNLKGGGDIRAYISRLEDSLDEYIDRNVKEILAEISAGEKQAEISAGEKQAEISAGEKQAEISAGEKQAEISADEKQTSEKHDELLDSEILSDSSKLLIYFCKNIKNKTDKKKKIIIALLNNSISPDIYDSNNKTPFFYLLFNNQEDIAVRLLLYINYNSKNFEDGDGHTYLVTAISRGSFKSVKMLIAIGAEINYVNKDGYSCLYRAVNFNCREIALLLIKKGADVNFIKHKQSILMTAASRQNNQELILALLNKNARVDIPLDYDGNNSLMLACKYYSNDILSKMKTNNDFLNIINISGETCLHMAARYCNNDGLCYLLPIAPSNIKATINQFGQAFMKVWGFASTTERKINDVEPSEELRQLLQEHYR